MGLLTSIQVPLGNRSYDVQVGEGLLPQLGVSLRQIGLSGTALVVTNEAIDSLYGQIVVQSLTDAGFHVYRGIIRDGEDHKNYDTLVSLYDQAVRAGLDRGSVAVALGGGVIGDITGFFAATYMRGIPFVQCPTTLLAQVDASVGGKTGINHPKGKNMIGAFHQPSLVMVDIGTLRTLSQRDYRSGLAEVVKHGLIADAELLRFCIDECKSILEMKDDQVAHIVARSVEIKRDVVAEDEREHGLRAILNFGHSVGHAIEATTGYGRLTHGEAIALGMVAEARLSCMLGLIQENEVAQIKHVLQALGLPVSLEGVCAQDLLKAMEKDKKNRDGKLAIVLLEELGRAALHRDVSAELVAQSLSEIIIGTERA